MREQMALCQIAKCLTGINSFVGTYLMLLIIGMYASFVRAFFMREIDRKIQKVLVHTTSFEFIFKKVNEVFCNRLSSQLAVSSEVRGGTKRGIGVYMSVYEDSSPSKQFTETVAFRKRSNKSYCLLAIENRYNWGWLQRFIANLSTQDLHFIDLFRQGCAQQDLATLRWRGADTSSKIQAL